MTLYVSQGTTAADYFGQSFETYTNIYHFLHFFVLLCPFKPWPWAENAQFCCEETELEYGIVAEHMDFIVAGVEDLTGKKSPLNSDGFYLLEFYLTNEQKPCYKKTQYPT